MFTVCSSLQLIPRLRSKAQLTRTKRPAISRTRRLPKRGRRLDEHAFSAARTPLASSRVFFQCAHRKTGQVFAAGRNALSVLIFRQWNSQWVKQFNWAEPELSGRRDIYTNRLDLLISFPIGIDSNVWQNLWFSVSFVPSASRPWKTLHWEVACELASSPSRKRLLDWLRMAKLSEQTYAF